MSYMLVERKLMEDLSSSIDFPIEESFRVPLSLILRKASFVGVTGGRPSRLCLAEVCDLTAIRQIKSLLLLLRVS